MSAVDPIPLPPATPAQFSVKRTVLTALGLTFLFLFLFIFLTAGVLGVIAYQKLSQFATAAGSSIPELEQLAKDAWQHQPIATNGHKTILLLGVDTLAQRGDVPPLTDTMMLLSLNLENGGLHALSFPRDLWSESYKTKINALYYYGRTRSPDSPEDFPTEVLSELTGVEIHHTIVLTLDQVATLIDILGGVTVQIETGFTDTQFPRDDVDIHTVRDPELLYKTITFVAGEQLLTGSEALEYMRSRHSGDEQGTDDARSVRQQQVIAGLVSAAKSKELLLDVERLGKLYRYYTEQFETALPKKELLSTAKLLYPHRDTLQLSRAVFPLFPEDPNGVITHPKVTKAQPQWIYAVLDPTAFQAFAKKSLGMSTAVPAEFAESLTGDESASTSASAAVK